MNINNKQIRDYIAMYYIINTMKYDVTHTEYILSIVPRLQY